MPKNQPVHHAPIDKALLGMLFFIASEVMIFAGLISAFLILRAGTDTWPPVNQPRLPVLVTAFNTLILIASLLAMRASLKKISRAEKQAFRQRLSLAAVGGLVFLAVQGIEWARLVNFGLTFTSSIYGGVFYTLVGCHGLHVLGAMIAMSIVLFKAFRGQYTEKEHRGVAMLSMYWHFVVGIWPALYILVYLS